MLNCDLCVTEERKNQKPKYKSEFKNDISLIFILTCCELWDLELTKENVFIRLMRDLFNFTLILSLLLTDFVILREKKNLQGVLGVHNQWEDDAELKLSLVKYNKE